MIIGHSRILDFLKKSIANDKLAHAYLFSGPADLGKREVALEFVRILFKADQLSLPHPDIGIIEPGSLTGDKSVKESGIGIKQIKVLVHQMSLYPYQAKYKIAIIDQAERMTADASNSLLKTLEEPIGKAIIILITNQKKSLLETITSRCQTVNFLPVPDDQIEGAVSRLIPEKKKRIQILKLSNGRPQLAMRYANNLELLKARDLIIKKLGDILISDISQRFDFAETLAKDVSQTRLILNQWLVWFRDVMCQKVGYESGCLDQSALDCADKYSLGKLVKIIKSIYQTDHLLANSSMNHRLALETLMLEI